VRAGKHTSLSHPPGSTSGEASPESDASPEHLVIHLRGVGRTVLKTLRMFVEGVMIPGTIFAIVLATQGSLLTAVLCALGWYYTSYALRWLLTGSVPGTLALCGAMFHGRAAIALLMSSAAIYLLQPIFMSLLMAGIFLASALAGRPLTERIARDFVHVPEHILARDGVRKMFCQVAMLWAVSRAVDAAVTTYMYTESTNAGMISRSTFTPALAATSIAGCVWFAMRAMRRDGVAFQRHSSAPTSQVRTVRA
jgi:uncharacterized membrane protein